MPWTVVDYNPSVDIRRSGELEFMDGPFHHLHEQAAGTGVEIGRHFEGAETLRGRVLP